MKKLILTIMVFLSSVSVVHAETKDQITQDLGLDKVDISQYLPIFHFNGIVSTIINLLFAVLILFFVVRVVLTGFKIAGAGSDAGKRQEGFKGLINAVIGLVVSLLAIVITNFILGFLGVTPPSTVNPDCRKLTDSASRSQCITNTLKLGSPSNKTECDYVNGSWDGKQCVLG